ncbi:hypothetical protein [Bacillus pseudomycoides]|nr:hypothetical protein [Bacillus pseudomycoides]
MQLKVGRTIKHMCWQCYNKEMEIYKISGKVSKMIWVKCTKCGAVDDILL